MGKAPRAVPPGEIERHSQLPLLCVTSEKCTFGGSAFPLEALRVSSQAPSSLRLGCSQAQMGQVMMAMGLGGIGSPRLEFFLIPLSLLSLRQ